MISIVLPFKDSEETLNDCVNSIISQSYEKWELIAIDDTSSDRSNIILTQLSKKDQRIKVYGNPGIGIVDALNHGIAEANSEFIARMDSDDVMHPARLLKQLKLLKAREDLGLVSCLVNYVGQADHNGRGYKAYVNWTNKIKSHSEISMYRFIESPFAHPSVMFRKELISKYGGYQNGNFPEDYELWLRFLKNNVKMEKVSSILMDWYDQKNRLSRIDSRYELGSFQRIKAKYFKYWIEENIQPSLPIHAWGAGKLARKQIEYFEEVGIPVRCSYEVDSKKIKNSSHSHKVLHFNDIPRPGLCFIVVLVGQNDVREKISNFLVNKGYKNEKNFLLLA